LYLISRGSLSPGGSLQARFQPEKRTVPAGGLEDLERGQVAALETEKIAAAREIRVPAHAEMGAPEAMGRPGGEFLGIGRRCIIHKSLTVYYKKGKSGNSG
jgi:hypothetical protein